MKAKICLLLLLGGAFGWMNSADAPAESISSPAGTYCVQCPAPTAVPEPSASPTPTPESTPEPVPEDSVAVLSTTISSQSEICNYTSYTVDADLLRSEGVDMTLPAEGPQILIIHSHATEAYTPEDADAYEASEPWRTLDTDYNVVAVGDALAAALEDYGLRVIHDRELYDWPDYNSAYVKSGEAIENYLALYPDIAMVIDLHRDALGEGDVIYKTVAETSAGTAAQMMFVVGSDENLTHPLWQENLKLALALQDALTAEFPGLMRPLDLSSCRYNQQLTTGSLILEVGSSGNSLAEAITAVQLFARAAAPLLCSMAEASAETELP